MSTTRMAIPLMAALIACGCGSPAHAVRPVIYASFEAGGTAMNTAPMIFVIQVSAMDLTGHERDVAKPPGTAGPQTPTIPLHLARIKANVLITIRGEPRSTIEFYSWVWASGQHGGPRLFRTEPGDVHVIFLRNEGGYLRTVGDYPSYDLELRNGWAAPLAEAWKSERLRNADPLDRLIALRLRVEFERMTEQRLREGFGDDGPKVNHHWVRDLNELLNVAGAFVVAREVDDACANSTNVFARFAACYVSAQNFPGRCAAYQSAIQATRDGFGRELLTTRFVSCQARNQSALADIRSGDLEWLIFYGAKWTGTRRQDTLRVLATVSDRNIRAVACEAAAGSIPECAGTQ